MIDERILRLTPKRILCPLCGEWHDWKGKEIQSYNKDNSYEYECNNSFVSIWGNEDTINISTNTYYCLKVTPIFININANLHDIEYDGTAIKIPFQLQSYGGICKSKCRECYHFHSCNFIKIGDNSDYDEETYFHLLELEFKLEFASKDFNKYSKITTNQVKEEATMSKTTIWEQLYEHSPKENVEITKHWVEKYKPTLKWALPVVSIYAAYRILNSKNSKLCIDNINTECENKLGFTLDNLKDSKALSELMVLGGMSAAAYAAIKAVSSIYKHNAEDISVEQIEEGMDKLDGVKTKFGWIQPKTEAMLPVAVSVIIVYVMTQKPTWLDDVKNKVCKIGGNLSSHTSVYMDMVKLFVADKLHVDLNNENDVQKVKKFAFLAAIVGIGVFLYGRNILGDKAVLEENAEKSVKNGKIEAFMAQIISIMEKLMPTAFAGVSTFLITKKILKSPEEEVTPDSKEVTPDSKEVTPVLGDNPVVHNVWPE